MLKQGERIRQWLIAHEDKIDFSEDGFIKRTTKASRKEWEMFYELLDTNEIKKGGKNGINESNLSKAR